MSNEDIKRTSVYFKQSTWAWLVETARKERRSVSSMCDYLIEWHQLNNFSLGDDDG